MPREVVHTPYGEQSRGLGVTGEAIQPSEVLARHGVGGNAEVLIQAVRDHNPRELVAASAKRPNFPLTTALKKGELEGFDGVTGLADVGTIAGEGSTVHDATVRGAKSVVYTAADAQGTLYKGTFELDDPDGTHVSQAEVLAQPGSVAAPIVAAKRAANNIADQARQAELDAREKALAAREREIMQQEKTLEERRVSLAEQASQGDQPSGDQPATAPTPASSTPAQRPDFLPESYDALNAEDAAKAVAGLEGEQREQAIAYEEATKNRQSVRRLREGDAS